MAAPITRSLELATLLSFFVATIAMAQTSTPQSTTANGTDDDYSSWGAYDATGRGFLIGRNEFGELTLGAYAVIRYINQLPAEQTFTDHLGNIRVIDPRNDIQFHRAMVHLKGWLLNEKLRYQVTVWSVLSTNQTTLYGFAGYRFSRKFNAYAGINTIGGSRSLMGSHPLWLANDRVMADEFFRPGFTGAAWVNGELVPGFWYNVAVGNSLSQLGFTASQLTRDLATGATVWWMPTTKEFGPSGSYGDWEYHEQLATRFGISEYRSRENRFNNDPTKATADNYQVKLADSLLLFSTGSLAPGVTVNFAEVRGLAFDAGIKYRGIFLQAESYHRWLSDFDADGPLPVSSIHDRGFYVQGAFFPIKQKLELYGATSWVYGDEGAGFDTSHEYIQGLNYYPFDSRYVRLNVQVLEVDRSPVSSLFGFYVGGQKGTTVSSALSFVF
jgi:hypothetical protein